MLTVLVCLNSCMRENYKHCPIYPIAGPEVAKELEKAGNLPHTWEWLSRIETLRQELEQCRRNKISG